MRQWAMWVGLGWMGAVWSPAAAVDVHFTTGERLLDVTLKGIEGGTVSASVKGSLHSWNLDELSLLDFQVPTSPPIVTPKDTMVAAHLVSGEVIVGSLGGMTDTVLQVNFQDQALEIPRGLVKGLKFVNTGEKDASLPLLDKAFGSDVVKLASNVAPGMVLSMTPESVVIQTPVGISPPISYRDKEGNLKVVAVIFKSPASPVPTWQCRVKGSDGLSVLQGTLVGWAAGGVRLKTSYAPDLALKATAVSELWLVSSQASYLSDLAPAKTVEESPWGKAEDPWVMIWRYKNNLNCRRQPMLLGERVYKRGIGVHTKCELTYAVPDGFSAFECLVGIDGRVAGKAKEITAFAVSDARILMDGVLAYEKRISGADTPQTIRLPLKGAKMLTIVADYGEKAKVKMDEAGREEDLPIDFGDWVNFAEARFVK